MEQIGKLVVIIGIGIVILGFFLWLGGRIPWLGRLPGDFYYHKGNFTFYFPLVTSIIASIVITLILWVFRRK